MNKATTRRSRAAGLRRDASSSRALGLAHPRGEVTLGVEHAPDLEVLLTLDVEHEVRNPHQRPRAQTRQLELMDVPGRPGRRMTADLGVPLLQCVDEARAACSARGST